MSGVFKDICLARAADPELHDVGQDGGLVSAMLVYALGRWLRDTCRNGVGGSPTVTTL